LSELDTLLSSTSFRVEFLKEKGFEHLLVHFVKKLDSKNILKILSILNRNFMEDDKVFESVFTKSPYMITTLVWLLVKLRKSEPQVVCKVYELLGSLPQIAKKENYPEKIIQKMMLSCFTLYAQKANEKRRFSQLLFMLETSTIMEVKTAIMHLVNEIINMYSEVESRISMRLEFTSLEIEEILGKIGSDASTELKREIDHFNDVRNKDNQEYKKIHEGLVTEQMEEGYDIAGIVQAFSVRWSSSFYLQKLISHTLCHLLQIPTDDTYGISKWLFINKVVSQISSKYKQTFLLGKDDDIDFEDILSHIQNKEIELRQQIEQVNGVLEKQKDEIKSLEDRNHRLEGRIGELKAEVEEKIKKKYTKTNYNNSKTNCKLKIKKIYMNKLKVLMRN